MKPVLVLSDEERDDLRWTLFESTSVPASDEPEAPSQPYTDYLGFSRTVAGIVAAGAVPRRLLTACSRIREERHDGTADAHVVRNCPTDPWIPDIGNEDPTAEKLARKRTFVSEGFLELFGQLVGTPLLSYASRFGGAFFTDVVTINRYRGMQTGYSDGEVVFHNDRTAHSVRADYITLLGMNCPPQDLVYTSFVSGRELLKMISPEYRDVLRQPFFVTPFDVVSRDVDARLTDSERHPILSDSCSVRYVDTHTTIMPDAPAEATRALLAFRDALVRSVKVRHRMLGGDLLTFANQDGLHSRDHMEITDPEVARRRWLLKTYAFRDAPTADQYSAWWTGGLRGRVGDSLPEPGALSAGRP